MKTNRRLIRVTKRINVNGDFLLDFDIGANPSFVLNAPEAIELIQKIEEKL